MLQKGKKLGQNSLSSGISTSSRGICCFLSDITSRVWVGFFPESEPKKLLHFLTFPSIYKYPSFNSGHEQQTNYSNSLYCRTYFKKQPVNSTACFSFFRQPIMANYLHPQEQTEKNYYSPKLLSFFNQNKLFLAQFCIHFFPSGGVLEFRALDLNYQL